MGNSCHTKLPTTSFIFKLKYNIKLYFKTNRVLDSIKVNIHFYMLLNFRTLNEFVSLSKRALNTLHKGLEHKIIICLNLKSYLSTYYYYLCYLIKCYLLYKIFLRRNLSIFIFHIKLLFLSSCNA